MLISVWSLGKFFKSGKLLYKIFSVAKLLTDPHTPGVCCQKEYRHGWILDGCLLSKVQLTSCQILPRLGFSFSPRCILTFMSVNMSHHDRARLSLQMCTRLLIFYNTPSIFYSVSLQRAKLSHPEDTRPRCRSGTSAPGSQPPRSPSSRRWDHSLEGKQRNEGEIYCTTFYWFRPQIFCLCWFSCFFCFSCSETLFQDSDSLTLPRKSR